MHGDLCDLPKATSRRFADTPEEWEAPLRHSGDMTAAKALDLTVPPTLLATPTRRSTKSLQPLHAVCYAAISRISGSPAYDVTSAVSLVLCDKIDKNTAAAIAADRPEISWSVPRYRLD